MMTIDNKRLNLVMEIWRKDKSKLFVHSKSLPTEVFEQYWQFAGPTLNALYTRDFGLYAQRYAKRMLLTVARESGKTDLKRQEQAVQLVEKGFLAEIRRLTNVFALADKGWKLIPFDDAIHDGILTEAEIDEVDNAIVFFTCAQRTWLQSQDEELMGALDALHARTVSLECTDFKTSLMTLIAAENSGATVTA
jgi:hypothetical protein